MNTNNIRLIRNDILAHADHFHMRNWMSGDQPGMDRSTFLHKCGTSACIAGFCALRQFEGDVYSIVRYNRVGREFLGLDEAAADYLFQGDGGNDYPHHTSRAMLATAVQAARVLNHLLRTGKVDWTKDGPPKATPVERLFGTLRLA